MDATSNNISSAGSTGNISNPPYEPPVVRVMNEVEVLTALQVNATTAGSAAWWTAKGG